MNKIAQSTYRVRFNDCDMLGHLNNSSYIDYFMNAREDHLRDEYNLVLTDFYKKGLAWVVVGHEIVYLRPALYDEVVLVQSTLISIDEHSLHVEMMMMNQDETQMKAIMRSKLVHVSSKTGQKMSHDAEFINWASGIVNPEVLPQHSLSDRIRIVQTRLKEKNMI